MLGNKTWVYNIISLESKLALGAHDMDCVLGNVTLRFTDGTEKFIPIGQDIPLPVNAHEYCYCDDANEVKYDKSRKRRWVKEHATYFISFRAMMQPMKRCLWKRQNGLSTKP